MRRMSSSASFDAFTRMSPVVTRGSTAGTLFSPKKRSTSSTRSISSWMSPRYVGTVMRTPSWTGSAPKPRRRKRSSAYPAPTAPAHRLRFLAGADDDRLPAHLREIVGVERMAERHHHVIGDVDDVVDRPQTDRLQPALNPLRRWFDGDAADDVPAESRAHLGSV